VKYKENGDLVIPLQDTNNKVWNLQTINTKGEKKFEYGGKKQGNFFILSKEENKELGKSKAILLVEGLATGLTVHRASNYMDTIVCFDAGNITSVVDNIKEKFPEKQIIIMADDDLKTEIKAEQEGRKGLNLGLTSAYKVKAKFPDIQILKPSLTKEEKIEQGLSDFNDLEKVRSKEFMNQEVQQQIKGLEKKKSLGIGSHKLSLNLS
jgi:putative DNA primase/helicase